MIRRLASSKLQSPSFRGLLLLAAELPDEALDQVIRAELPLLEVVGYFEEGDLIGFVAFEAGADRVVIEYLAVAEQAQRAGVGSDLVKAVTERAAGRPIYAETDDEAVEFYRRLNFQVETGPADPRWPEQTRYSCRRA